MDAMLWNNTKEKSSAVRSEVFLIFFSRHACKWKDKESETPLDTKKMLSGARSKAEAPQSPSIHQTLSSVKLQKRRVALHFKPPIAA